MKKALILIVALAILIITPIAVLCVSMGIFGKPEPDPLPSTPKTMFASLSSFDVLEKYETGTKGITDADLFMLEPADSYVAEVEYNDHLYYIYAYVFDSDEQAKQYFALAKADASTDAYPKGQCYTHTSNFAESTYCAYYENRALKIEGVGYNAFCEFVSWLIGDFPIDLIEVNKDEYVA